MVYMGSKAKYADKIVPLLQKIIDEKNITSYFLRATTDTTKSIKKL